MNIHPLRWLVEPPPAGLAIEFRHQQAVVARFSDKRGRKEMDLCLQAPLPTGVLDFSMIEPNIKEPESLALFLKQMFEQAGVRGRRIALTVPDPLARISMMELPNAPRSQKEIAELLRFHLRKSLPFGMEEARVAFDSVPGGSSSFLTGVMHEDVVSQYEGLLEGLGFHVGVVEISSISLLNLWRPVASAQLHSDSDYFFINIEESYFTVILVRKGVPILLRTLGRRSTAGEGEGDNRYQIDEILREMVPTLIFYREKLGGGTPARVYYRSLRQDLEGLSEQLEPQFEAPVQPIDLHLAVTVGDNLEVEGSLASTVSAAAGAALGKAA